MYSPPVRAPHLYKYVAQQIKQRIIDGELAIGDRLPPEQSLADQFEVSRIVIREAIKTLEREGLVEVQQGRGTYVTDGTSTAFKESLSLMLSLNNEGIFTNLAEVRALLEPGIAAMAARRATDEDIEALEQAVAVMETCLNDPEGFVQADSAFHLLLANATRNDLIVKLIEPIVDLIHEMRLNIAATPTELQRGQFHHVRILAALKAHDPQAAREAMSHHMDQVNQAIHGTHDTPTAPATPQDTGTDQ